MTAAISNTSPLLYLYRVSALDLVSALFGEVRIPRAVADELAAGRLRGYDVPQPDNCAWLNVVEPASIPSEWLSLDLGRGELHALALALENPTWVVLLDDRLARRVASAAGLTVWGTLRVLLEAKATGLIDRIGPYVARLDESGMWLSEDVRRRVLALAGERISD